MRLMFLPEFADISEYCGRPVRHDTNLIETEGTFLAASRIRSTVTIGRGAESAVEN